MIELTSQAEGTGSAVSSRQVLDKLTDPGAPASDARQKAISVSFESFLSWFLNIGRSYLPPPHYPAAVELSPPPEEQLRELFDSMDEDHSGQVNLDEATWGTLSMWPFVSEELVESAFEAADANGSGFLEYEEFGELIRCLQFLNKNRHQIAEVMGQYVKDELGELDFAVCLSALGMAISDKDAAMFFNCECIRLKTHSLSAHQFLMWVCRRECIDKATVIQQEQAAIMRAQEALEASMTDFGDNFFDDVVRVVVAQNKGEFLGGQAKSEELSEPLSKMKRSAIEAAERVRKALYTVLYAIPCYVRMHPLQSDCLGALFAG